jgi:hypothetical protein
MSTPLFSCYEALVAAMLREDFISASNARDLEEEVDDRVLGKLLTEQRSERGLLYWPMHVGLQGLKGRPELNGCCCLALRVDLKTGRLAVRGWYPEVPPGGPLLDQQPPHQDGKVP